MMEILEGITGINSGLVGMEFALALNATLVLFFLVSPLMGILLHRASKSRANFMIAWLSGVIVVLGGNFVLSYGLRRLIPPQQLSDEIIMVLSLIASICCGVLLSRFMSWYLKDPGKPEWVIAGESVSEEMMTPFDRRRREHMERRKRARRL